MREIRCRRCGSEWEFPRGIEMPGRCPYCGAGMDGHFMDDREALAHICQEYGYEVLCDSTKLDELMEQYVEDTSDYSRALRVAIREGIGWNFFQAYKCWKYANDEPRIRVISRKLSRDLGMREEVCQYIIDCFTYAYKDIGPDREISYKDKDDVYMELADTLAGWDMKKEAECLYRVSLDAGNENAYLYYHEPEDITDNLLKQAEDFYYGYTCDEDVEAAIKCLVQYFEERYSGIDMRTESHQILEDEVLELLLDYCEEALSNNESEYAFKIIKETADVLGEQRACKIIADYYVDEDNFWKDPKSGRRYERRVCIDKLRRNHKYTHLQYCMDIAQEFSQKVAEKKYAEVLPLWEEIVEKNIGELTPYGMIGVGYYSGSEGIPVNREKGFYWMKRYYDDVQMGKFEETPMLVETEYFMGAAYLLGLGTKQDILRGQELFASVVHSAESQHADYIRMCGNCFLLGEVQGENEEQVIKITKRPELAMYCMKKLEEWDL